MIGDDAVNTAVQQTRHVLNPVCGIRVDAEPGLVGLIDEFVRHKALDLIGDLALAGGRFDCTVEANRPSHRGNVAFARALYDHCSSRK